MSDKLEELNQKVKETTENYLAIMLKQAEERLLLEMVNITVENTVNTEKVVNYLLLVSGAAIPLFISNSDKLLKILGSGTFKWLLILLLISAILGFLSKICQLLAIQHVTMYDKGFKKTKEIMDEYYALEEKEIERKKDIVEITPKKQKTLEEFYVDLKSMFPKNSHKIFFSKKDTTESNLAHKNATFALSWHYRFLIAQIFFTLIAFVIAIFGIEV